MKKIKINNKIIKIMREDNIKILDIKIKGDKIMMNNIKKINRFLIQIIQKIMEEIIVK